MLTFHLCCGIRSSVKSDARLNTRENSEEPNFSEEEPKRSWVTCKSLSCFIDLRFSRSFHEKSRFGWQMQIAGMWVAATPLSWLENGVSEEKRKSAMCLLAPFLFRAFFRCFNTGSHCSLLSAHKSPVSFQWNEFTLQPAAVCDLWTTSGNMFSITDCILFTLSALFLSKQYGFLHTWVCTGWIASGPRRRPKCCLCVKNVFFFFVLRCFATVMWCTVRSGLIVQCSACDVSTCCYNGAVCWRLWWVRWSMARLACFQ